MSVIIESVLSYDHINGPLDKTIYFPANQSSIQFVEVKFRFETYLMPKSTVDNLNDPSQYFIQAAAISKHTGKLQDLRSIYTDKVGGWGDDYKVGDNIQLVGSFNGSGTIIEIYEDGQTLITDINFGTARILSAESYVAITTPQQASEYKFNLIENQEPLNYISKVDGDEQRSTVSGLVFSDLITEHLADMLGNKSWQFGTVTIKGNGTGSGNPLLVGGVVQAFTVTHEILVAPLMLADEFGDIQARIKPTRLLDGNSFKYVASIGLSEDKNNPNDVTVVEEDEILGNVGWFDENLNGKPNNYSFSDPVYERLDSTINPSLELTTNQTTISYSIFSAESSFSNGNSKVIAGINFAPSDKSQYRDIVAATSQTMEHNFIFDQVVETVGSGGVAVPRQFGTDLQVIDNVKPTFVNSSQIDVVVTINMALDVVSRIGANTVQRYMHYVEVANHLLDRANTDKVQLLIDATDYFTDLSDDDMITMSQSFLRHPFSNIVTETEPFINVFKEADFVGVNNFFLDKNTREDDVIVLTGITSEIIARKTTGASFVLDKSVPKTLSAFPQVNNATFGTISDTNFSDPRGFRTPVDNARADTKLNRIYDDARALLGFFDWRSSFPTRIGWNDYTALSPVNDEFLDQNEPNDGKNQDWIRYDARLDWDIFYRTTVTAIKNGEVLAPYQMTTQINTRNYLAGDEWDTEAIVSFDQNDVDITPFGIKYADGRLQANFTFIGLTPPVVNDLVIDFHIYVFEEGTFRSIYTLSSAYDAHPDTLFKSIDASNRTVVTDEGGNVFRGEVLTDSTKMSVFTKAKFQVTALIYDKRSEEPPVPPEIGILEEDGVTLILEEGNNIFVIEE